MGRDGRAHAGTQGGEPIQLMALAKLRSHWRIDRPGRRIQIAPGQT